MSTITEAGTIREPRFKVSWPRNVEVVAIRKHQRVNVSARCSIAIHDGADYETELFDISEEGCAVYLQAPLDKGTQMTIAFGLPDGQRFDNVHGIVRGVFTFDNTPVAGIQFVQLPAEQRLALEFFIETSVASRREEDQGVERVLVIHESLETVQAIRKNLEGGGYRVTAAQDIVDGFCIMRLSPPTAIVLQADLPQLSGTQICRLIRGSRSLSSTALILYGGNEKLVGPQLESIGANGHFSKPELAAKVVKERTQAPAEAK